MTDEWKIHKGLRVSASRPSKNTQLFDLIQLAKEMNVGDAVELSYAQTQTFRTILYTLGFKCITDGYRCDTKGKTLVWKL